MNQTVSDKLSGRKAILSVSGGKDSAATSLYLRELGIEHVRVFAGRLPKRLGLFMRFAASAPWTNW
jgi:predicted PP-loop superfamily ATPase